ncbi:MAG TPA: hypothetical protein VFM05_09745, partial [Candidatus Saccharimonadales bacterium]|nr:hypothetical protein [Candidatus Saccharimonadales bacterium]
MLLEELSLPLNVIDKGFKVGLGAAVAGVGALVGAMGAAIKMGFDWADSLDGIQDVMGVTTDQAAAFAFIAKKSGTDVNSFTRANTILAKGLVKVDGTLDTTGKALEAWGVSVLDSNGNMKNQAALLDDIGDKYKTLGT